MSKIKKMQRFRASFMAQVYQFAHILVDIKSKLNIGFISGKSLEYNTIQDQNNSTEETRQNKANIFKEVSKKGNTWYFFYVGVGLE